MGVLAGPFAVAAAVLLVGGALKLRDAGPAERLLSAIGVPASGAVARLSAPFEIMIGVAALVHGSAPVASTVAVTYAGFAAVVAVARRHGRARGCGCFGRRAAPVSGLHVVVNAALALVAAAAAVLGGPAPARAVTASRTPADALLACGLVALATGLTVAVLTALPETLDAGRRAAAGPDPRVDVSGVPT